MLSSETSPLLAWAVYAAIAALSLALILTAVRLVWGPTLPDRVVALDMAAYTVIAFIIVYAVATRQPGYLNDALALGSIAFLGTITAARYLERAGQAGPPDRQKEEDHA